MLEHQALTERIIGFAIEVHRTVGPGCWIGVRRVRGPGTGPCRHQIRSRVTVPVIYKGVTIPLGFRADVVVETPSFSKSKPSPPFSPPMNPNFLTYLRMSHLRIGLLNDLPCPAPQRRPRRFIV